MRLVVSISQSKNLSATLVSDLKAGKSFVPGHGIAKDKVALEVSNSEPLCISIRNTETSAYVYERKIPLSLLRSSWSSWVALFPPGDPLGEVAAREAPSPGKPQIFLTVESEGGFEDLEALQHAFSKLEHELELNKQQARERTPSTRPSLLDREAAEIQAKEREMASIKAKISAMSDAKRQATSAEEQLKEVMQEVRKMRERLAQLDGELNEVKDRKQAAETEIAKLQRSTNEAKETLRLRTLSVAELRNNRDETEHQLSQTLREREQWRESASKAQNDFDSHVKSASVELDHWRSEAQELAQSIAELDEQKKVAAKVSVEEDAQLALQRELEEVMASFASMEAQRKADDEILVAAEERQRGAEERLHQAEQAAHDLRTELREEGAKAKGATEVVKRDLAEKASKVAQLEGSLSENRNQLKTIQQHVHGLMQDLLDRSTKSSDDEAALSSLAKQLQQEEEDLEDLRLEKEKLEDGEKQPLQEGYHEAISDLEKTSLKITELNEVRRQLDSEVAQIREAAGDVEGCRQEARQRIEEMQQALEAAASKKLTRAEAVTSRLHRVTLMEQEVISAEQDLQRAMAAATELRISVARSTAENAGKEEALLQRCGLLQSELEKHQESSLHQEEKQKALLTKLTETQQMRPKMRVQAEHAKAKRSELQKIAADLKESLDNAKRAATAEAVRESEMEMDLERQHEELEEFAEEAARQEALSTAMKTALSEQRAVHQSCVEARRGQSALAKDQELKVEEQVKELRAKNSQLALTLEEAAAACGVEKERLAELRHAFQEEESKTLESIEDATKELAIQECATSLEAQLSDMELELRRKEQTSDQALVEYQAEAASLRKSLEDFVEQSTLASGQNTSLETVENEDSERKVKLLKDLLVHRASSLNEASNEGKESERKVQALQQNQKLLQEEYSTIVADMKSQVSKGNGHYGQLQELEEDIRRFQDEAELLTLGLHEAEHRKTYLLQEKQLLDKATVDFGRHLLQQWAKEVLRLRVAAQVQSYEDEMQHWKAASEGEAQSASGHQQAAEELLRQKATALEDQLVEKEKLLREFEERDKQMEEVPGNIRSIPSALHGSLGLASTRSGMEAARRALVIGCNYCSSFCALEGCANDAWNVQCLLRQSLQYSESQVRCLIDFSDSSTPPKRRPTRENIIAELQWLTGSAKPDDNILLYFSGYGAQQPESEADGSYEGHLVPMDFAEDLPEDIVREVEQHSATGSKLSPESTQRAVEAGGYRLVPMSLITLALHSLPSSCKVTLLLDCCQSSVVPLLHRSGPGPSQSQRVMPRLQALPAESLTRVRLLNLPPLPGGHGLTRQMGSSPASSSSTATRVASPSSGPAQPSALEATERYGSMSYGGPSCKCYSFASCQNDQVCCELPIEGSVQGAGTWAFVKAVTACHFSVSLTQHSKAMDSILQSLRRKSRWIQQTPVIQLSASANVEDLLILP